MYKGREEMFESEDKDDRIFKLYINLGDVYQKSGNMGVALKHFYNAYDAALYTQNKKLQVDVLIRIVEVYFSKGEIDRSMEYAHRVEELIKTTDYIQGKLDISLYWLKVYYIRNDYYKAREIGNEAIKLCKEEHIVYKGRLLNALARLYSEIASVTEHLNLLNQSLECFEKANYLRGILGVTNNIASVYADKLQDNEKALEYFFKLRQRSEHSEYKEFDILASINIGEVYYKTLNYKESFFWYKEALVKAKRAKMESRIFYLYVDLSQTCLKLNNYKEAEDFFKLAQEELKNHPDQGEAMPLYYKVASTLSLKIDRIPSAKVYIKQALELIGNEECLIKWDCGIIYELIKLKEAKGNTEVVDALNGVRYILTKYKNPGIILDIVNNVANELNSTEYGELAIKLVNEYKNIA